MKRTISLNPITLLLAVLALGVLAAPALAQSGATYKITSSTVDSGGGVSTSITYKVSGTIGQHDAGDPTGATYTILGGFWFPSAPPDPLESSANPWSPDPAGVRLNRAGAFKMPGSATGQEVTIRVTLVDLYIDSDVDAVNGCPVRQAGLNDLTAFNGQVRYLGPPSALDDNDTVVTAKFVTAELQSTPFFRDWSPAGLTADLGAGVDTSTIYYYGVEVFPCSVHEVQQGTQSGVYSTPALVVRTALWGDIWPPFGGGGQPNFTDIGEVVDAFKTIAYAEDGP